MQILNKWIVMCTLLLASSFAMAIESTTMEWEDLRPDFEKKADLQAAINHSGAPINQEQSTVVNVRKELDGKRVRLPGFVVPLEGDENTVTEFFLVPYFGACIHVPAPPPNQIIYVKYPKGAPIDDLWGAVWLEGIIKTETMSNDLATVGYSMDGLKIEVYED